MELSKKDQVKVLMVTVFLLGFSGLAFTGCIPGLGGLDLLPLIQDGQTFQLKDYHAVFYLNGTLEESLRYNPVDNINYIARSWQYSLSDQALSLPYMQILNRSYPPGTTAYEWDWKKQLKIKWANGTQILVPHMPYDLRHSSTVNSLAKKNEVGCYKPVGSLDRGNIEIGYTFKIHPPIEYDESNSHWNILLADRHPAYNRVEIRVHDPQGYIDAIFSHPDMKMEERDNVWTISGSSPENGQLGVEMLLRPDAVMAMEGFPRYVSDVKAKTLSGSLNAPLTGFLFAGSSTTHPDAEVSRYSADLYLDGTVEERFVYYISGQPEVGITIDRLYRTLGVPLSQEKQNNPYVELEKIKAPSRTIPYAKMNDGITRILAGDGSLYSPTQYYLWHKYGAIPYGESCVGYYSENNLLPCQVDLRAQIHPALICDEKNCLVLLDLSQKYHQPFGHLEVKVHDPREQVSRIFVNPLLSVRRDGSEWIVSGKSNEYYPLTMKLLMDASAAPALQGFTQTSQDVREQTAQEEASLARNVEIISAASSILAAPLMLTVLAAPLILLLLYRRYGQEKTFMVPAMLRTMPRGRKPWLVNLIFKGTPDDFDKGGLYATIIDLQRRKILDMRSDGEGIEISLLDELYVVDDNYERKVLEFIKKHSRNEVFDTKIFSAKIAALRASGYHEKSSRKSLYAMCDEMHDLMIGLREDISQKFYSYHHKQRMMLVAVPLMLMVATSIFIPFGDINLSAKACTIAASLLFLQSLIPAVIAPRAVFGKWKDDYYKEKLEWDAFKAFLGDSAMMQEYAPQDISVWREWLIYGTALGVGDSVSRVMNDLNVPVHIDADTLTSFIFHFDSCYDLASQHVVTREENER